MIQRGQPIEVASTRRLNLLGRVVFIISAGLLGNYLLIAVIVCVVMRPGGGPLAGKLFACGFFLLFGVIGGVVYGLFIRCLTATGRSLSISQIAAIVGATSIVSLGIATAGLLLGVADVILQGAIFGMFACLLAGFIVLRVDHALMQIESIVGALRQRSSRDTP
ncbi:MAG: hypothetical protein AB7U20_18510 [Planctomycetaceae bacterium]